MQIDEAATDVLRHDNSRCSAHDLETVRPPRRGTAKWRGESFRKNCVICVSTVEQRSVVHPISRAGARCLRAGEL